MVRKGADLAAILAIIAATSLPGPAGAQDLVYKPVNPSFGGDPFNSSHLLSIAGFDRPDPPRDDDPFGLEPQDSQADFFVRQLESRILSRLSSDITDAIFGPDADPTGTFQFDETTIAFETLLDGSVTIDIINNANGTVTEIVVPGSLVSGAQ